MKPLSNQPMQMLKRLKKRETNKAFLLLTRHKINRKMGRKDVAEIKSNHFFN